MFCVVITCVSVNKILFHYTNAMFAGTSLYVLPKPNTTYMYTYLNLTISSASQDPGNNRLIMAKPEHIRRQHIPVVPVSMIATCVY